MKPARLAVLAIALAAGGAAAYLMSGEDKPQAPEAVAAPQASVGMTEILVASVDLQMGQTLKAEDLRWLAWPDAALSSTYVTRAANAKALEDAVGSIVRTAMLANEPVRPEKLVKAGSGFMSAILPAGMRAVAIVTDTRGSSSAGGFILPNDYVDIIKTYTETTNGASDQISETLLTNVRVLAVGQVVQEKGGVNVVTAETATVALTPTQAETVTLAQKVGQLSLVLRSIQDSVHSVEAVADARPDAPLTVVRFGVAKQQSRR